MAGWSDNTSQVRLAFIFCVCAYLMSCFSFAVPLWTIRYNGLSGLWIACTEGRCYERYNQWISEWVRSTQVLMCIVFVCLTFAFAAIFCYLFLKKYDQDRRLIFLALMLTSISSIFTLVTVIIWLSKHHWGSSEMPHVSLFSAVASSLSTAASSFFLFVELRTPARH